MWITDGVLNMKRNCGSIISRKSRFQFNLFCSAVVLSLSKDDYGNMLRQAQHDTERMKTHQKSISLQSGLSYKATT